jgi:hypothetical protein
MMGSVEDRYRSWMRELTFILWDAHRLHVGEIPGLPYDDWQEQGRPAWWAAEKALQAHEKALRFAESL